MTDSLVVVADNNVVISSFLYEDGVCGRALKSVQQNALLITSHPILEELRFSLRRKKFDRLGTVERRMRFVEDYGASCEIVQVHSVVLDCRDPKDDMFLSLALDGHADLILTGDDDLRVLHPWRGIPIVGPAEYLKS